MKILQNLLVILCLIGFVLGFGIFFIMYIFPILLCLPQGLLGLNPFF